MKTSNPHDGTTLDEFLNQRIKDPDFKAEYEAMQPEFAIISAMIDARNNKGITQKELSERTGISQADISRVENGIANPSLKTLKRLAQGMEMNLTIQFTPKEK